MSPEAVIQQLKKKIIRVSWLYCLVWFDFVLVGLEFEFSVHVRKAGNLPLEPHL